MVEVSKIDCISLCLSTLVLLHSTGQHCCYQCTVNIWNNPILDLLLAMSSACSLLSRRYMWDVRREVCVVLCVSYSPPVLQSVLHHNTTSKPSQQPWWAEQRTLPHTASHCTTEQIDSSMRYTGRWMSAAATQTHRRALSPQSQQHFFICVTNYWLVRKDLTWAALGTNIKLWE